LRSFREKMAEASEKNRSRLVLALDVSGPAERRLEKAERVLEDTKELIAAVKLNHHLILPYGLRGLTRIVDACKESGLPLIADLKLNDIESTNLTVLESLVRWGFDAVIANPFVGYREGLGKLMELARADGFGVILLVYMSHEGANESYELRTTEGEPLYRVFAKRAKEWGADGVIVSAKAADRVAEVREIVGRGCMIFSPGVGPQGGRFSAGVASGADFVIVGRLVTESERPAYAIRTLK
jgi:orotidine-5'-phosphate decarboxylase